MVSTFFQETAMSIIYTTYAAWIIAESTDPIQKYI